LQLVVVVGVGLRVQIKGQFVLAVWAAEGRVGRPVLQYVVRFLQQLGWPIQVVVEVGLVIAVLEGMGGLAWFLLESCVMGIVKMDTLTRLSTAIMFHCNPLHAGRQCASPMAS
jgi:hypothetical protein